MHYAKPISPQSRIDDVDAARGFLLLGIILVNITLLGSPAAFYPGEVMSAWSSLDSMLFRLRGTLLDARFISLYALLFGWGVRLQAVRSHSRALHIRRMFWLLCFGVAHNLLWSGDILVTYAILGIVVLYPMVYVTTLSNWVLIVFASILLLLVAPMGWGMPTSDLNYHEMITLFNHGSWGDRIRFNLQAGLSLSSQLVLFAMPAGFMLLGVFLQNIDWFRRYREYHWQHAVFFVAAGLYSAGWVVVFVLDESVFGMSRQLLQTSGVSLYTSHLFMALTSLMWLLVIMYTINRTPLRKFLAAAGRLSLTNYLGQTVLATLFFSGLNLYGHMKPTGMCVVAIVIYIAQVAASYWWVQHFRYGPAEWLWRTLTYAKIQPFRR